MSAERTLSTRLTNLGPNLNPVSVNTAAIWGQTNRGGENIMNPSKGLRSDAAQLAARWLALELCGLTL